MQIRVPSPAQLTPRADFRPEEFARVLQGHGTRLLWEQAELCPCGVGTPVHSPHTSCTVCDGRGWHWRDAQEIRGVVMGMADNPALFQDIGLVGKGLAYVTVAWEQTPGINDRFTLLDGAFPVQEIRTRAAGTTERMSYPIKKRTASLVFNGLTQATELSVRYLRKQGTGGVGGAVLVLNTDFAVTTAGLLDWTLGDLAHTAPAVGAVYAVSYYASPRYVVKDLPAAIRQKDQQPTLVVESQPLPVRVLCQLDWHPGVAA